MRVSWAVGFSQPGLWRIWESERYDGTWKGITLSDGAGSNYWIADDGNGNYPTLADGLFIKEIRPRWEIVDQYDTVYTFTEVLSYLRKSLPHNGVKDVE